MYYCALYLGVLEHTHRVFVYCSIWCILGYILLRNIYNIDMGARIGGGGRVSFRPSTPPPLEKIICYLVVFFCYLFSMLESFYNVLSPYGAAVMWIFFVLKGIIFWLATPPPPPPYEHFCGAQEYRYGIATH